MLVPALVFLAVTCGMAGLFLWFVPTRTEERLRTLESLPAAVAANWTATAARVVGPLANLSLPEGDWERSALRIRFLHAGLRDPDWRILYFGCKTLLPVVLAAAAFVAVRGSGNVTGLGLLFVVLCAALAGCYLPNLLLAQRVALRRREIFENFPDAADLMLVCVEAGLGLDAAMSRVAEEMRRKSVALAEELHLTNLEMRAGAARETALRNLALRTGVEETSTFATMLSQADRFGTSIGESLRVFSDDLRHKRQMRAEERAAKIPTKMLLPLVLCIFPAIIGVVLGPAMIQIVRTILPMLAARG